MYAKVRIPPDQTRIPRRTKVERIASCSSLSSTLSFSLLKNPFFLGSSFSFFCHLRITWEDLNYLLFSPSSWYVKYLSKVQMPQVLLFCQIFNCIKDLVPEFFREMFLCHAWFTKIVASWKKELRPLIYWRHNSFIWTITVVIFRFGHQIYNDKSY